MTDDEETFRRPNDDLVEPFLAGLPPGGADEPAPRAGLVARLLARLRALFGRR